ncbi:hypothetical protein OG302_22365 [Streptomyces sp. NBC_01283]|nr:hypothetical protein OG302_22365 [Streptomyces sp. NBC_01283]
MISRLLTAAYRIAVLRYDQPPLDLCTNCMGYFPPSHFPCV